MHDGIELEKRGIPTVTICTDMFVETSKTMAQLKGFPDYPFLIVPHPIGNLKPEELLDRAKKAAPEALRTLLGAG